MSAGLTFLAARSLHVAPGFRAVRRVGAAIPAAGIAALVAVVATRPPGPPAAAPPDPPRPGSVLLASGVDSRSGGGAILEIDPHVLGFRCRQTFYYSYAGPGPGQPQGDARCPKTTGAPYRASDTFRPTEELVGFVEAQLRGLPPPVTAAFHSQGAWIAWAAAAERRTPGLEVLVLVGPFPDNPVPYVQRGERGPGRVGVEILHLVAWFPRPGGTTAFEPDLPLGREWLGHPTAVRQTLARPLPGHVRVLSVPSVFDLPLMPDGPRIPGAVDACPVAVIHPNLPYAGEFHEAVGRFLDGEPPLPCPWWRTAVGSLFRPFAAPPWGR